MKKHLTIVGVFIVSGLLLFTVGIFLIGDRHEAFSRHEELYIDMAGVNGLTPGTKVRVEGFDAGQVKSIRLPDHPSGTFRLKLEIANKLHSLIREDSVATVETDGLVGDKYLLIRNGSDNSPEAKNGSTIPSKEPVELSAVIAKVSGVVDQANTTISDVRVRLDGVLDDFKTTVNDTNGLITDARSGKGTVATLLNDPSTAAHIKQVATNADQASVSLEQASEQARQLVSDFQSRDLPAKVDDSVTNVRHASEQIDQASQKVNSTLTEALAPDRSGTSAAQNLRETLSNVNLATANLADDTEAIKHEFFFRGFFKKRGFYSLSELTPGEYRNNSFFQNSRNERFWLGTESFTKDADGTDILSVEGQAEIDQIAGQAGDGIMELTIMIEGYSTDPLPYQQIVLSNAHSLTVAHYLEKRFKLHSANLGTISLDTKPPQWSGKDSWNGACIVFLSKPK
ncbi:MlaD family protein [Granulicella aggregans]|uniref:MlaD family protein n=1 Tax=Granulicella aggregans TaxID=474949 RepID=UPI0021E043BC|nr:MlaD family protein [Granulicella aggregans]